MTSLLIEILQSWLPSRSSTLLDLTLNSLGALTGVVCYMIFSKQGGRPHF
jgi:glycopeptide antibiotics resistance protein